MAFPKGKSTWNKGLPKELQPFYKKKHSKEDRKKSMETRRKSGWFKDIETTKKRMSDTRKRLYKERKIRPPLKFPDEKGRQIIKLYEEGLKIKEIAKKIGCDGSTINRYTKTRRTKEREQQMIYFKNNLTKLSENERGYIAGIIDGEGSIIINLTTTYKKPDKKYYVASIVIGNQDKGIIDYMYDKLGLWTKIGVKINYLGKKDLAIRMYGKDMINIFLKFIFPYLHSEKTKKRAEIMLDFCNKAKTHKDRENLYWKLRIYYNRKNQIGNNIKNGKNKKRT